MNSFHFDGRVAKAPALIGSGERARAQFTLIRNDYAGTDEHGSRKERQVAVQLTAFGGKAEAIAKHSMVGDQLIVEAHLANNNWTDRDEVEHYDYQFVLDDFTFGAPGHAKREELAANR